MTIPQRASTTASRYDPGGKWSSSCPAGRQDHCREHYSPCRAVTPHPNLQVPPRELAERVHRELPGTRRTADLPPRGVPVFCIRVSVLRRRPRNEKRLFYRRTPAAVG